MTNTSSLLNVQELQTCFNTYEGTVRAVNNMSFHLNKGEVLGIVGESGCGKSVTALSIMRLISEPPGKIIQGTIHFHELDLISVPLPEMRKIRGNRIAMIFQEPMTSLNPVFTIGDQISEMFTCHQKLPKKQSLQRVEEMLFQVQIPEPKKRMYEYPHQLSGGMRQRAMIAMALSCNPELLIADEPTTALDVTVQAQILDLMIQLKEKYNTAIIMITHDLGIIAEIAVRIMVMYAGKVVEEAQTSNIFENAKHPYTQALLQSIPKLGDRSRHGRQRLSEITGMVPNPLESSQGCDFSPRCPTAMAICKEQEPPLTRLNADEKVRCWRISKH